MLEHIPLVLAARALFLVSFWKPVLFLLLFIPWAMLITRVYDKHAARFHLPRRKWNLFHLVMGFAAAVVYFMIPLSNDWAFLAGFFAAAAVLVADLVAYAYVANKDERVPEKYHIKINMESFAEAKAEKAAKKLQAQVALAIRTIDDRGKYSVLLQAPPGETPEFETRIAAEALLMKAVEARASQVDIGPGKEPQQYQVSYLVDGMRQNAEALPAAAAIKVMDFWKAAVGLDVADRRRKQAGLAQVEQAGMRRLMRVTTMGATGGMRTTILIDPEVAVNKKVTELGLLEAQMKELTALTSEEKGTVLIAAPPDSGRTTVFYTVVRMHDVYIKNIQTVETDPQLTLDAIRVNKFEAEKEGTEFSTTVRSVLRRDPDVVGVAELPDANTAKEIARADQERTRIYLSLKADGAMQAIQTWIKAVGDPKQAASALHGVIACRLVRRLCANCRVPYPPPPEMLKKLGLPDGKVQQLFKKGGQVLIKNKPDTCPVCSGSGYLGQVGVFEVYKLGPEEQALVAAGNFPGLRAQFRKKNLPTIQQAAISFAVEGVTSVEEVMRLTAEAQPAQPSTASPGGPAKPSAAPAAG